MKNYTHVIWDFNGTILDDLDACLRSANALLCRHGLAPLKDLAHYRAVFGFPIIEYYRRLGFDFSVTPYPVLAKEWVELYNRFSASSGLCPGVPELLARFSALGMRQIILSATEREMLLGQVRALGIIDWFDEIRGLDNIHAYSKTDLARDWRAAHPDARVLFLGDTDHDAATAAAIGADCLLVASGHQPRSVLERCPSLAVLDSLLDGDALWGAS